MVPVKVGCKAYKLGRCLVMPGRCLVDAWWMPGSCMEAARKLHGSCEAVKLKL
jgi:hypothetical protein